MILDMVEDSYDLVVEKLPRATRERLGWSLGGSGDGLPRPPSRSPENVCIPLPARQHCVPAAGEEPVDGRLRRSGRRLDEPPAEELHRGRDAAVNDDAMPKSGEHALALGFGPSRGAAPGGSACTHLGVSKPHGPRDLRPRAPRPGSESSRDGVPMRPVGSCPRDTRRSARSTGPLARSRPSSEAPPCPRAPHRAALPRRPTRRRRPVAPRALECGQSERRGSRVDPPPERAAARPRLRARRGALRLAAAHQDRDRATTRSGLTSAAELTRQYVDGCVERVRRKSSQIAEPGLARKHRQQRTIVLSKMDAEAGVRSAAG